MIGERMRILYEFAAEGVPEDVDLWPVIRACVEAQTGHPRPRLVGFRKRWALAAAALLLAAATGAYAVAPLLSRTFRREPGLRHVDQAQLGQVLSLSQTVDGFTVRLERAYADVNRIVLGYMVRGPEGGQFRNYMTRMIVTDERGTVFPLSIGAESGLEGQRTANVMCFDTAVLPDLPPVLHLHVTVDVAALPATPTPDEKPVEAGPFSFELSVPVAPGRVMDRPQTAEAAGVAITLERVVVAPSATRAILRFAPPAVDGGEVKRQWEALAAIRFSGPAPEAAGQPFSEAGYTGGGAPTDDGAYVCDFPWAFHDYQGEWILSVSELVGIDLENPGQQVRVAGPWVFRFVVP